MRRRQAKKHNILPDPKFKEVVVTKFVNSMMEHGKKSTASYGIFYDAMDKIESRTSENPHDMWKKALENVSPNVEVRSRRVGGATFQIPTPVRENRRQALAMKWLISYSRKRNEKTMASKLASEVIAASKEEGAAFKKKEDMHKMAEANKAFSHFKF